MLRRQSTKADVRQTLFFGLEEELAGSEEARPKLHPRRATKRTVENEPSQLVDSEQLSREIAALSSRLSQVEGLLYEVLDLLRVKTVQKEYYTTVEAAKLLGKRPYTVREWCRLGRVNAEKALSGRGIDEEWRIAHVEITRIQNEGLLPKVDDSAIGAARRLPR